MQYTIDSDILMTMTEAAQKSVDVQGNSNYNMYFKISERFHEKFE